MKNSMATLAAAAVLASLVSVSAGVSGKVTLAGEAPTPQKVIAEASADPLCGPLLKRGNTQLMTRLYVVGEGNGLADVFVFISKGLEGKTLPAAEGTPVLDQVNCEYTPYIMGVMKGQEFVVRNSDAVFHNVNTQPRDRENKGFNIAQPIKGMTKKHTFAVPELFVRFKCDVHRWMFAYVCVADSPFYAVTAEDGTFEFPEGLPAGTYTVSAVHRKILGDDRKPKLHSQEITVEPGKDIAINFALSAN